MFLGLSTGLGEGAGLSLGLNAGGEWDSRADGRDPGIQHI